MISEIIKSLKNGFELLEKEDFSSAKKIFEKILEKDKSNAHAYIGVFLAEKKLKRISEIELLNENFEEDENFKKAILTGDENMISALNHCISAAQKRKQAEEKAKKEREEAEKLEAQRKRIQAQEEQKKLEKQKKLDESQNILIESIRKDRQHRKKKQKQKRALWIIPLIVFLSVFSVIFFKNYSHNKNIEKAHLFIKNSEYATAYLLLTEIQAEDELQKMKSSLESYAEKLSYEGRYEEIFSLCELMQKSDIPYFEAYKKIIDEDFKSAVSMGLKKITYPQGKNAVITEGFCNITELEEIIIPEGITKINAFAFDGCTSLKKVTLPSSLVILEENAFFGCTSLEEITIPKNVSLIGRRSFSNCNNLTKVVFESPNNWITNQAEYNFTSETQTAFDITRILTDDWKKIK